MRIAVGIARGIQFLHSRITPGMYGNDLKIENILLDKTLTAKISSYNISLPSKVGSESPLNGQDNPNRLSSTESAEKNDIYQLGVILLEVISGKPITSETQLRFSRVTIEIARSNRIAIPGLPLLYSLLQVGCAWEPSVAAQIFGPSLERGVCRSSERCVAPGSGPESCSFWLERAFRGSSGLGFSSLDRELLGSSESFL
ncbi:unnamed protein product [Camellia sinensis]